MLLLYESIFLCYRWLSEKPDNLRKLRNDLKNETVLFPVDQRSATTNDFNNILSILIMFQR